ncbi:YqgE/AlgH family protein [uncultured Bacteroides sp.]|uniref:YqgE/AlgH family protein n=1 Tax=uncultured Bacteroides sp. TaxID=162156 RepID=UPI002AA61C16|nr:YqgE/AlgH family protein [uncultured Bacteroides sp.]
MKINADIFKIESNNVAPSRGKILISEPFLLDATFGRSVVLLIDHTKEGTMGLVMNKEIPLLLNDVIKDFQYLESIPIYKGGPLATDTLFYLHTLPNIPDALPVSKGLYLNGDFDILKTYILQGNPIEGNVRFFLGYSGWDFDQLHQEIKENTWLIGKGDKQSLMNEEVNNMWKKSLKKLGHKYATWSRFPQIPSLN